MLSGVCMSSTLPCCCIRWIRCIIRKRHFALRCMEYIIRQPRLKLVANKCCAFVICLLPRMKNPFLQQVIKNDVILILKYDQASMLLFHLVYLFPCNLRKYQSVKSLQLLRKLPSCCSQ